MVVALGSALVSKITGASPAEKAFKPWWDNCQNYLVYGLVMLGLIVSPTSIIVMSPLDCTWCSGMNCKDSSGYQFGNNSHPDPKYNTWWVKKYCSYSNENLDHFTLYFPFILIISALLLVLIERGFDRAFKTGELLDDFYNLLQKDDGDEQTEPGLGGSRHVIEISHRFSKKSNYWMSYMVRTISELVVALALLTWMIVIGLVPRVYNIDNVIPCDVYGNWYECSGHSEEFYYAVLIFTLVILFIYVCLAVFNVIWIFCGNWGTLSKVMISYQSFLRKKLGDNTPTYVFDKELLGNLWDVYYNNKDLRMLLNLLTESTGIASSLRILAMFDNDFCERMQASNVRVAECVKNLVSDDEKQEPQEMDIKVDFEHAEAVKDIFTSTADFSHMYTIEISPPGRSPKVMSIPIGPDGQPKFGQGVFAPNSEGDNDPRKIRDPTELLYDQKTGESPCHENTEDEELMTGNTTAVVDMGEKDVSTKISVPLKGLSVQQEYAITVCTIVNGHTIAKTIKQFNPMRA